MPPAETINVAMDPELLQALRDSVEAGEYASLGQALDAAVGAWQRRRREEAEHLGVVRARIRRSLDDPSPSLSPEEVDAYLEALFAEARDATSRA